MFIYLIVNRVTGKYYVGQHKGNSLKKYFQTKLSDAFKHRGGQSRLYNSMRKHGRSAFSIHAILSDIQTREELDRIETDFIEFLRSRDPEYGYNICKGGEGFTGPHSEETKERMSESHMSWYLDNPKSANPWVSKICPECGNSFSRPFHERDAMLCSSLCRINKLGKQEMKDKRAEGIRAAQQLPETRDNMSKGQSTRRNRERELGIKPIFKPDLPRHVWTEEDRRKGIEKARIFHTGRAMPESQRVAISNALHGLVCDEKRKETLDKGRHTRWHSSKGIIKNTCKFCIENKEDGGKD